MEVQEETFLSPRGRKVSLYVRSGTADHNNAYSCLTEDEYGLRERFLSGVAVDVGAHIGGVTLAMAVDNPEVRVISIEALSANVEILQKNVEKNGVAERVTILHAGACALGTKKVDVEWDFDQTESGAHHRFIGNASGIPHEGAKSEEVPGISLASLVEAYGEIEFMKIDCEGCEYEFLRGPVEKVKEIRGEFHAGIDRIIGLLEGSHNVSLTGGTETFGEFRAVRL